MFKNSFPNKKFIASQTAKMLLEIDAINFRNISNEPPYILTSGMASPVYIDCRKLISYPRIRNALMDFACATLLENIGFQQFDVIAGGETAGIPFAAFIAERLCLPMIYIRKQPKGFGKNALIEGNFNENDKIILIEDLTTDGGSKIKFAKAIREAGGNINHTFAIFYYNIFPQTQKNLKQENITLHYLTVWQNVLAECKKINKFDNKTLNEVEKFLANPLQWSKKHGGKN